MYAMFMGNESDILDSGRRLTVQQAAALTRLSVHTLRYYERIGLLDAPERKESSGHRQYSDSDIRRVEFLKRLRTTGMPIRDMQNFIALYRLGSDTLAERTRLLCEHRARVIDQVTELQDCLHVIDCKIASYEQLGAVENCLEKGVLNQ